MSFASTHRSLLGSRSGYAKYMRKKKKTRAEARSNIGFSLNEFLEEECRIPCESEEVCKDLSGIVGRDRDVANFISSSLETYARL
ncbi:hypothetical protein KQX54_017448 [Cotesia glomerata]|uniref:Uncharacterized protein n=1 Tax=Cotesia glomerata TaxID=32391 RepID=A0AAV7I222_COTGL|nr:hypothetical protein KQX54_017448 [Cotesia glomerata]